MLDTDEIVNKDKLLESDSDFLIKEDQTWKDEIETREKNSDFEQSAVPSSEDDEQDFL